MRIELHSTRTVCQDRNVSKSKHYEEINSGLYPRPIQSSGGKNNWGAHETELMLHARLAGFPDEHLRELVIEIEWSRNLPPARLAAWYDKKIHKFELEGAHPITSPVTEEMAP